jgi:hypothetical protein
MQEHGQSPAEALDDLLAAQLEAEQRQYDETVKGALSRYLPPPAALHTPAPPGTPWTCYDRQFF